MTKIKLKMTKVETFKNYTTELISIGILQLGKWFEIETIVYDNWDKSYTEMIANALDKWSSEYSNEVNVSTEWEECECCGSYCNTFWTIDFKDADKYKSIKVMDDGHFGDGYGWSVDETIEVWKNNGFEIIFEGEFHR